MTERKEVPPAGDLVPPPSQAWLDAMAVVDPLALDAKDTAYESTLKLMVRGGMRIQRLIDLHGVDSKQVQSALDHWSAIIRKDTSLLKAEI